MYFFVYSVVLLSGFRKMIGRKTNIVKKEG